MVSNISFFIAPGPMTQGLGPIGSRNLFLKIWWWQRTTGAGDLPITREPLVRSERAWALWKEEPKFYNFYYWAQGPGPTPETHGAKNAKNSKCLNYTQVSSWLDFLGPTVILCLDFFLQPLFSGSLNFPKQSDPTPTTAARSSTIWCEQLPNPSGIPGAAP